MALVGQYLYVANTDALVRFPYTRGTTHIAASGNVSATARALYLSPRAVVYRLERIAKLTGHSPQDPESRFVLELAVRSRRLAARTEPSAHTASPPTPTTARKARRNPS